MEKFKEQKKVIRSLQAKLRANTKKREGKIHNKIG
jgi:hypothetical protein